MNYEEYGYVDIDKLQQLDNKDYEIKNILKKSILSFHSVPDFRSVQVVVDVDPY